MKKNENNRVVTAAAVLLMLLTPALSAMADCSMQTGVLTIDPGDGSADHTQSLSFKQQNGKRCVTLPVGSDPATREFSIEVKKRTGSGAPDLGSISVVKKNAADPVDFEVTGSFSVGQKHYVNVEFSTTGDTGGEDEFFFDLVVDGIGVLDPAVQIIRTTGRIANISALEELAKQYLDPADHDEILGLIRSLKSPAENVD